MAARRPSALSLSRRRFRTSTYHDSPPSLVYSELSDDFEDNMDATHTKEDVSAVMTKVLVHLERVVEHLRGQDENDAANSIARDVFSIVETFNNATAPWDIKKCLMDAEAQILQPPIQSTASTQSTSRPATRGESWASVAATEIDKDNRLVKFRPCDSLKRHISEEEPTVDPKDLRVVWILGWDKDRKLGEVTQRLSQGALFSMAYSRDYNSVCVIFQSAVSARMVLDDNEYCLRRDGFSIFGPGCDVILGHAYPEDAEVKRMSAPENERRRLTFARQQLFAHGMTEEVFKKDIYGIVGESNVELVWLFNTGNATVVFTSTQIARLVRNAFRKKAREAGPYKEVHVTFSHDPCERPMNLITQLPGAQGEVFSRSGIVRPQMTTMSGTKGRRPSSARNGPKVDAEGWQMVGKKR